MKWLRGIKKKVFKKRNHSINVDGVYYRASSYEEMLDKFCQLKAGDKIINPYNNKEDVVKELKKKWIRYWHYPNVTILEVILVSESGYYIYDYYDTLPPERRGW